MHSWPTAHRVYYSTGYASAAALSLVTTALIVAGYQAKNAIPPTKRLRDKVLHVDTTFSLGYIKPFPKFRFGSSDKAFGTPGAGGSFGSPIPIPVSGSHTR